MISFNKEQVIIVTGASSGLGEGTALFLNELGATVIGIGRCQERLDAMRSKCKYPENMFLEKKDLTEDIKGLPNYIKSLKDKYGKLSGLACCAGQARLAPLQILDYDDMKQMFDVNYHAPMMLIKGFADRRNNVGKGASIVCISSAAIEITPRGKSVYSGTKSGLAASIKCIAKELAPFNIRANCISPSDINTQLTNSLEEVRNFYPFGYGEVSDVANLCAFLLSDKAKWITGQNYILDCGSY